MGDQKGVVAGIAAVDRLCGATGVVEGHVAVPWSVLLGARRYLWFVSSMGGEAVTVRWLGYRLEGC